MCIMDSHDRAQTVDRACTSAVDDVHDQLRQCQYFSKVMLKSARSF